LIEIPRFFWKSRKKSNMTWLKWPSWGEVRKNHLKPRSVSGGDEVGLALMIREDQPDLGALEARQPLELLVEGEGQVERAVGDLGRDLEDGLVVDAGLRVGARHRVDDPDDDLLGLRGGNGGDGQDEREDDADEPHGCHLPCAAHATTAGARWHPACSLAPSWNATSGPGWQRC
jgi:hypothetical protein